MAATPKKRKSSATRGKRRSQPRYKVTRPTLKRLKSGKAVPVHMVTPENPTKNGVKFLAV